MAFHRAPSLSRDPGRFQPAPGGSGYAGRPAASSTCRTKTSSGTAPTNSTRSFTTVLGTPMTWYCAARSGNSLASTASATTLEFSMAMAWARPAAWGQYGQVGVKNTRMWTGLFTLASFSRDSAVSPDSPRATSMRPRMKLPNS